MNLINDSLVLLVPPCPAYRYYELSNHLSNVLAGRSFQAGAYRFGFNGKENDREWGESLIQDYGFRLYNPAIGKFLSVDPLSPEYPELTPYQFASNRPIDGVDVDGLEYVGMTEIDETPPIALQTVTAVNDFLANCNTP